MTRNQFKAALTIQTVLHPEDTREIYIENDSYWLWAIWDNEKEAIVFREDLTPSGGVQQILERMPADEEELKVLAYDREIELLDMYYDDNNDPIFNWKEK